MVVAICRLTLHFPQARSLKDRRQILRSLTDRLKGRFSASVAEVGEKDKWQRAQLGLALVGQSERELNSYLDQLVSLAASEPAAEITNREVEYLHYGQEPLGEFDTTLEGWED
jgi:uncharacterized protein